MIHLITYGNDKFEGAKHRLYKQAIKSNWFDTVTVYSPSHLDKDFISKFSNILKKKRGAGYWIWKSHIILKKLNEINDNDILIYLDAGCSINLLGQNRFNEYIEILNHSNEGIISFQLGSNCLEKKWTTKEIFSYFNIDSNSAIANTAQLLGGIRIMKKNSNLIKLIELESKVLHDNPLLFTDHYNKKNQEPYFIDNRHEQSIFSVIRKMHNPIILTDETYFDNGEFTSENAYIHPFWATRKRN